MKRGVFGLLFLYLELHSRSKVVSLREVQDYWRIQMNSKEKIELIEHLVEEMIYQDTIFDRGTVKLGKNNNAKFVIEFDFDDYEEVE